MPYMINDDNGTVLLVSDMLLMLKIMRRYLNLHRYTVMMENVLSQAVARAIIMAPDLIVIHAGIPMMLGYTLCQELRDTEATAHIPVVLVSLMPGSEEMRRAGVEVGAVGYLDQLDDWGDLVEFVQTYLPPHDNLLFGVESVPTGFAGVPGRFLAPHTEPSPLSGWMERDWGLVEDIEGM